MHTTATTTITTAQDLLDLDRASFLYQFKEGLFSIMTRIADGGDVHRAWNLHQDVYMPLAAEWIRATEYESVRMGWSRDALRAGALD